MTLSIFAKIPVFTTKESLVATIKIFFLLFDSASYESIVFEIVSKVSLNHIVVFPVSIVIPSLNSFNFDIDCV